MVAEADSRFGSFVMDRIPTGAGATLLTAVIAGISAGIAAKYTPKWRYTWTVVTVVLLGAQLIAHFYVPKTQVQKVAPSRQRAF